MYRFFAAIFERGTVAPVSRSSSLAAYIVFLSNIVLLGWRWDSFRMKARGFFHSMSTVRVRDQG